MAKLKILGIMGSPRIGGNTDILLNKALEGAASQGADIDKIIVDKLNIAPCKEYYGCLNDGNCVIRDDMDDVYPRLLSSDCLIIASPMFFYSITSQLKALIDRCQATWARKYILKQRLSDKKRKGVFIGVGATRGEKLFEGSIYIIKYFFKAIDLEYGGELLVRGVDKKGEIKLHNDILNESYDLGVRLVQK